MILKKHIILPTFGIAVDVMTQSSAIPIRSLSIVLALVLMVGFVLFRFQF